MASPLRFAALLSALLLSLPAAARAEEEEVEDIPADDYTQNVSISIPSLLGGLAGNYEYLVARRHGVLAEASYSLFGGGAGSWAAGAGYRYHFHPGMESLFAGAFIRYGDLDLEVDVKDEKFNLSGSALLVGANLGYRWQWGNGLSLAVRGGYGIPVVKDLAWSPSEPKEAGIFETFMGLDLELNAGYSF